MSFEKPFILTEEHINELIIGDYPQFGPMCIYTYLWLVADGDKSVENFYDEIHNIGLMNLSDYLVYHAQKYNQTLPTVFSSELQLKIKKIDEMFASFKKLIDQRVSLNELYLKTIEFLRFFGDEQRYKPIPEFEK